MDSTDTKHCGIADSAKCCETCGFTWHTSVMHQRSVMFLYLKRIPLINNSVKEDTNFHASKKFVLFEILTTVVGLYYHPRVYKVWWWSDKIEIRMFWSHNVLLLSLFWLNYTLYVHTWCFMHDKTYILCMYSLCFYIFFTYLSHCITHVTSNLPAIYYIVFEYYCLVNYILILSSFKYLSSKTANFKHA